MYRILALGCIVIPLAIQGCAQNVNQDTIIARDVGEAIEKFCKEWKPQNGECGYGWDYAKAWADMRDVLCKYNRVDIVECVIVERAVRSGITGELREQLMGMLMLVNQISQERLFLRLYMNNEPQIRASGLIGLCRIKKRGILREAIYLAIGENKWLGMGDTENRKVGLYGIKAYWGHEIIDIIQSEGWRILDENNITNDEVYAILGKDIRKWWNKNKKIYENE